MPDDDPLGPNEQDVAELAAASANFDGYLAQLLDLADTGIPTYVGMIVNGLVVIGMLSPAEKFVASVDEVRSRLADASRKAGLLGDLSKAQFEESLETFSSAASAAYRERRQEEEEIVGEAQPYLDDSGHLDFKTAPARIARRVMRLWYRHSVTLTEAQIFAPGQAGLMRPPVMRVALDQISAWWVIPLDAEGRGTVPLFATDDS
jgi:hypothetical protein